MMVVMVMVVGTVGQSASPSNTRAHTHKTRPGPAPELVGEKLGRPPLAQRLLDKLQEQRPLDRRRRPRAVDEARAQDDAALPVRAHVLLRLELGAAVGVDRRRAVGLGPAGVRAVVDLLVFF